MIRRILLPFLLAVIQPGLALATSMPGWLGSGPEAASLTSSIASTTTASDAVKPLSDGTEAFGSRLHRPLSAAMRARLEGRLSLLPGRRKISPRRPTKLLPAQPEETLTAAVKATPPTSSSTPKLLTALGAPPLEVAETHPIEKARKSGFSDLGPTHWAYASVQRLVGARIIEGLGQKFDGTRPVTRSEMAMTVARILDHLESEAIEVPAEWADDFLALLEEFASELSSMGYHLADLDRRFARLRTEVDEMKASGGAPPLGLRVRAMIQARGVLTDVAIDRQREAGQVFSATAPLVRSGGVRNGAGERTRREIGRAHV